jgi:hypothetical protein
MSNDHYVKDIDGNPTTFVQSGPRPGEEPTVQDVMRRRDPYSLHLMRQPMLMDFIPRFGPVEDHHITYFLQAQQYWLDEERNLRVLWRR